MSNLEDTLIEEAILTNVLRLLKKYMPDNLKFLIQYFQFFILYAENGRQRVTNLLEEIFPSSSLSLSV